MLVIAGGLVHSVSAARGGPRDIVVEGDVIADIVAPGAVMNANGGAGFRSLKDARADTTTPRGRLMLTITWALVAGTRCLSRLDVCQAGAAFRPLRGRAFPGLGQRVTRERVPQDQTYAAPASPRARPIRNP